MSLRRVLLVAWGLSLGACSLFVELDDGYVAGHPLDAAPDAGNSRDGAADAKPSDAGDMDASEAAAPLLEEAFDDPRLANWILVGSPIPRVAGSIFGHPTVFDNAGDPNYSSGAVSKSPITCPATGCTIAASVYVDFSDLGGCWATATLAYRTDLAGPTDTVTETSVPDSATGSLLGMSIDAVGDLCSAHPVFARRHAWFDVGYAADDDSPGGVDRFTISADDYVNKWVRLEIQLGAPGSAPVFLADGKVILAGTKPATAKLWTARNLYLGSRSSGSAGKAYHDDVRVLAR